ncbi:MAG: hypoxanthine phosphoribosyltransferase [Oscillospiraceae bacterium]|nr:hypoxanthine phosphoribosyltransferase [Oscillospiraceae bacterium]
MADIINAEYPMSDFREIIVSEEEIKGIICRIANEINQNYAGKKLLVCGILKGAFIFTSDLIRQIKIPLEVTFIQASSYGNGSTSQGKVKVTEFSDLGNYNNFDILVVDDILDTGNTLCRLKDFLRERGFKNIEFCTLLDKPERRESKIDVKYIGKQIANEFVVGYGLDFNEKYRSLPFIASLHEKMYENTLKT